MKKGHDVMAIVILQPSFPPLLTVQFLSPSHNIPHDGIIKKVSAVARNIGSSTHGFPAPRRSSSYPKFPIHIRTKAEEGGGGSRTRVFPIPPVGTPISFSLGLLIMSSALLGPSAAYTVYYGTGWVSGSVVFFMHEAKVSPSGLDTAP